MALFLTSKVRLHCDKRISLSPQAQANSFPDLKGQAPLRRAEGTGSSYGGWLFLTSKVRLHCDEGIRGGLVSQEELFLTSKVRLHCDEVGSVFTGSTPPPAFPDLKGQAPLRRPRWLGGVPHELCFS